MRVVVLLGVHGAGKTTLGSALPSGKFAFFPQIGTTLRAAVDYGVTVPVESFDTQVMQIELERDAKINREKRLPVIESWHIGNIAFAMARGSDETVARYRDALMRQLEIFTPHIVKLRLPDHDFLERVTEKRTTSYEALIFYRTVECYENSLVDEFVTDAENVIELSSPWSVREAVELITSHF
ncbi:hypothetical protein FNV62_39115 [Streptomyces sp. RLB3-17]|uniref:hypothetical protein n=1 Tax=Streptomyces sp. RLB3-17 TaxID=2594455 RepID=UPI00116535AA|nr:hypothetical protein [Streptomyces sp. RLB3-17]QDO43362.1 hypothetical protein FNV62_39115 [Streptomyces sp. RLB3-17]